jgi:hypothetical protein
MLFLVRPLIRISPLDPSARHANPHRQLFYYITIHFDIFVLVRGSFVQFKKGSLVYPGVMAADMFHYRKFFAEWNEPIH